MKPCSRLLVASAVLLPFARAQEAPTPAPELKQLEPLVGDWTGSGKMVGPTGATKWDARGTYRWCLDGHFLQEDFGIIFEGMGAPLVFRAYLGWDRENKRWVNAVANNSGHVQLHEMKMLPDGTMVQLMLQHRNGTPYAERSRLKVDGDTMVHTIEMMMAEGASTTVVDGTFKRGKARYDAQFDGPTWMGAKPDEAITRLARSAGDYDVKGQVTMAPGQPLMKIQGVDSFQAVFGGTVLHGHTDGAAEGMPGKYVGEVFWGNDAHRGCLVGVYVSNMGEVMTMDARWAPDGKLVATSSGTMTGQAFVQRMVMEFDGAGAATRASSHSMLGTAPPFESFAATYTQRK